MSDKANQLMRVLEEEISAAESWVQQSGFLGPNAKKGPEGTVLLRAADAANRSRRHASTARTELDKVGGYLEVPGQIKDVINRTRKTVDAAREACRIVSAIPVPITKIAKPIAKALKAADKSMSRLKKVEKRMGKLDDQLSQAENTKNQLDQTLIDIEGKANRVNDRYASLSNQADCGQCSVSGDDLMRVEQASSDLDAAQSDLETCVQSLSRASKRVQSVESTVDWADTVAGTLEPVAEAVGSAASNIQWLLEKTGLDDVLEAIDEWLDWALEKTGIQSLLDDLADAITAQLEPLIKELIRIAIDLEAVGEALDDLPQVVERNVVELNRLDKLQPG